MHIEPKALQEALRHFAERSSGATSLESSLEVLVDATTAMFGVCGSGLMFLDDSHVLRYVVASDERARVLEQVQEKTGQGPCVQSLVADEVVATNDIADDDRWPDIGRLLEGRRIGGVLGVPVHVGGSAIGSLNAYDEAGRQWDASDEEAIRAFAGVAEHVIAAALLAEQQGELVDQLQRALQNRVEIERAIGVVMGAEGLDAPAAFERLRRAARGSRRPVSDLAREVLESRSSEPLGEG